MNVYKSLRKSKNLTQIKLAEILSVIPSTICKWETDKAIPDQLTLLKIADYFNVSIDYLLGRTPLDSTISKIGGYPLEDNVCLPILGSISAGFPLEAQEDIEGYIYTSRRPATDYFALRVRGESMLGAGIPNDSIVIVKKQPTAENGAIVVALLNGTEATVKRFKILSSGVHMLVPENPAFEPIILTDGLEAQIIGIVVEIRVSL